MGLKSDDEWETWFAAVTYEHAMNKISAEDDDAPDEGRDAVRPEGRS